jgi:hypothetical protein
MNRTFIARFVALMLVAWPAAEGASDIDSPPAPERPRRSAGASAAVDLRPQPLRSIAPGTVIPDTAPQGWTHLVLIATPRIGAGDIEAIPRTALRYSSMPRFTILANVRSYSQDSRTSYYLDRFAIGTALEIGGRNVIATSEQTFGKDVGFIGRRILQENDTILKNDFRQVLRTRTMAVFDAQGFVVYNKRHARMVIRHAILVSPQDGKLTTFVWLMGSDGHGGYAVAERTLQILPANMHEVRTLSVDASKFTFGIPSNDAFALAHIPQGTPVKYSPELTRLAATRQFTPETALLLEEELQTRYAPLVVSEHNPKTAGR